MKKLTLGKKISGLAAILLLFMAASTISTLVKMGAIGTELKEIVEEDIPLTTMVSEITTNSLTQSVLIERGLRHGSDGDEDALKEVKEAKKEFETHGRLTDEAVDKARQIAEHAIEIASSNETRQDFQTIRQQLEEIEQMHQGYERQADELFALLDQGKVDAAVEKGFAVEQAEERIGKKLTSLLAEVEQFTQEAAIRAEQDEASALRWLLILGAVSLVSGIALSFFLIRSITTSIDRVICSLNTASAQLTGASGEVSSASQSLAEGASEQAAALEQTSSSMEELSAMTRQNADNADHADNLMKQTNQVIDRANGSMTQMTSSMAEIAKASEETSKIIKTIDEIAFQTNLLALNAAVEAARAGEAGAGFAVVADEVRNLAMRAAEAARNTSELIESTVHKVAEGSELVASTNEAFGDVSESTAKVGNLLAEIAGASKEQAHGIGQINQAVGEMDKVTQQNSAAAEQSAAASEELKAQSFELLQVVDSLAALVGTGAAAESCGRVDKKAAKSSRPAKPATLKRPPVRQPATLPPSANGRPPQYSSTKPAKAQKPTPEDVIPMDTEEFEDF